MLILLILTSCKVVIRKCPPCWYNVTKIKSIIQSVIIQDCRITSINEEIVILDVIMTKLSKKPLILNELLRIDFQLVVKHYQLRKQNKLNLYQVFLTTTITIIFQ